MIFHVLLYLKKVLLGFTRSDKVFIGFTGWNWIENGLDLSSLSVLLVFFLLGFPRFSWFFQTLNGG